MSPMKREEYHAEWEAISEAINRRARGACELCGARKGAPHWLTGTPVVLTVHHINGIKADNRPLNLLALCPRCHLRLDAPYRRRAGADGQTEIPFNRKPRRGLEAGDIP